MTQIHCDATSEDLKQEPELLEQFCQGDYKRCVRFRTYQDLKIEYLVRRKLQADYGA
ncbi:hypothetical protein [Ammoniphilus resinae]|nr:hypothetical protein [Ammoniphilus resinae]